ncbi:hypothetical protein IWQ52_004273 [Labrenzia sp. EL_159]|nr:hypothetical protein [Labrenzia sp. EL_162]MBG6196737.1 hypothetical protein [Labrenzia sp. EL_159]
MSRFAVAKSKVLDHLETLIPELFGGHAESRHHRRGRSWNISWPWRTKSKASQTIIWLDGARRGGFKDFTSGVQGDAIDLVAVALEGAVTDDSRMRAVAWVEDRFGIRSMSPAQQRRIAAEAEAKQKAMAAEAERRKKIARDRARKFFFSCENTIFGHLPEIYLKHARGIDARTMPHLAPAFRFHPACEYWLGAPRDADGNKTAKGPMFPALITAMVDQDGKLGACHYTFLAPDGRDKAEAIPFGGDQPKAKMMFPDTAGLMIRATYGPSGLNMERAAEAGISGIASVTEGIEDALSAGFADPELRSNAAGSLPNMLSLYDHAAISGWLIFKDNDWDNPQALAQFDRAVRRLRSFKKPVQPVAMPASWGKDVNDALKGEE